MTGTLGVWIAGVLTAAGGLLGAVIAWRKIQPEKDSIVVTAAQGALVVQSGVLDELREELQRIRADHEELRGEIRRVRSERDELRTKNIELQRQVERLERRVRELEAHTS